MMIRPLRLRRLRATASMAMLVAFAFLICQGCGTDMGPPPDENAKTNQPPPEKLPTKKAPGGATLKVKSIKDKF